MRDVKRIDSVILAAGSSKRLGFNKLFVNVEGEPVLARTVRNFLDVGLGRIFVVTGFEQERVEHLLRGLPVVFVHNRFYDDGMSTSVRAVLPFLGPSNGLFLHLGDKPFFRKETFERIISAYLKGSHRIIVPIHEGEKGHPVLFDVGFYLTEVETIEGDTALKPIIERHSEDVLYVEGDEGILLDVDTEEDLDLLRRRGYKIEKG
jgi:molybdenum cofactor cytidylyltransferase